MAKVFLRILIVSVIVLLFLSVNPLIDLYYQYKFTHIHLVHNPNANFNVYYPLERIQFDKNFLYCIVSVIACMLLVFWYSQEKLLTLKKAATIPSKGVLFKIFFLRLMALIVIVTALMVSLAVFVDFISNNFNTSSNLFAGVVILAICNLVILMPYIACLGIYDGFKARTFLKFCVLLTIVMGLCMAVGVGQFAAGGIAALIGSVGAGKTMFAEFKAMSVFFEIEGKTLTEMFNNNTPVYSPRQTQNVNETSNTSIQNVPKSNAFGSDIVFYAPSAKAEVLLILFAVLTLFLSYFGYHIFNVDKLFSSVLCIFIACITAVLFVLLFIRRKKTVLVQVNDTSFTCIDTDFLKTAHSKNQLNVLWRLYFAPKYKKYQLKNIRKFEILNNTSVGSLLVVYPFDENRKGVVFYFDALITTTDLLNLLQSKLSKHQ